MMTAAPINRTSRAEATQPMQLKNILHVDDHSDILVVAQLALEKLGGYSVSTCTSGEEMLASVRERTPDLILLDVMMPRMDGLTALKLLRDIPAGRDVPVIFVTANIQPDDVAEYRKHGAIGVITKPFNPMTLARTIAALWGEFQATQGASPSTAQG